MRIATISEAPKKGTTPASDKPPFSQVNVDTMKPGKKVDLKLKMATILYKDVKSQIYELNSKLSQLKSIKDMPQATNVAGLLNNLKTLEKNLQAEIKKLSAPPETPPEVTQLLSKIAADCSEYIAAVKKAKRWLYRGSNGPDAFVGRSWEKRRAKDSNQAAQALFDQYLAAQGFVALRGNSIFTTSDVFHAENFGDAFIIFPINGKSAFTYTTKDDLTLDDASDVPLKSGEIYKKITSWAENSIRQTSDPAHEQLLQRIIDDLEYEDDPNKIMKIMNNPKYAVLNIPAEFTNLTMNDFIDMAKFNKVFKPSQTDLAKALKNEKEVYVQGVYYALKLESYGEYVKNFFKIPVTDTYY